ncbi:FAD-dependent oxidoreductase [Pseudalkalibacillus salsuginis]|uniref:FAD-dependent oxidoreductase n=1 Tax=Pseudalkalibacillus salsuginis TaxID=2910972 RepID=UPI001F165451|nr:FAD-dependent oxidoreductase [Pseudalkalibacillus salsuginis]MCF6410115.1 FAD-dependent oxidoreductase [Pseudalkalibacillus salsuginis]
MTNKNLLLALVGILLIGFSGVLAYKQFSNKETSTGHELNPAQPEPFDTTDDPATTDYEVIVIGGEPEGVAAAVSAARNGAKTLLIEEREGLGGLLTFGMLNFLDIANDSKGHNANAGIFNEWHELVGGKVAFDIERGKKAFLTLTDNEENLTVALDTELTDVQLNNKGKLETVTVKNAQGVHTLNAKRFIDSTQDGALAVMAGAPFFVGREDIGIEDSRMAVSPMIHLKNVEWNDIQKAVDSQKFGEAVLHSNVAWGFGKLHHMYEPVEEHTRLRGLNIARNSDGSVVINALQIFEVDGLDKEAKVKALEKGKKEIQNIVKYLRKEFPGFEKTEVASYPTELYVRETRHFEAEYQLSIIDVWENNDQWDSIGFGAYPVDVQATSVNDWGYVIADPVQYAIPFRSLVPKKVDGLLIASKASGYSSLAAGSARVVPTGMTAGQAAGAAAALSIKEEITFRKMTEDKKLIKQLQETLRDQGANLYKFNLDYSYEGEWFYPKIKKLLTWGLISGGYENEFDLEKEMTVAGFAKILRNALSRIDEDKFNDHNYRLLDIMGKEEGTLITRNEASRLLISVFGDNTLKGDSAWEEAKKLNLADKVLINHLKEEKGLNRAEAYYLLGSAIEKLEYE